MQRIIHNSWYINSLADFQETAYSIHHEFLEIYPEAGAWSLGFLSATFGIQVGWLSNCWCHLWFWIYAMPFVWLVLRIRSVTKEVTQDEQEPEEEKEQEPAKQVIDVEEDESEAVAFDPVVSLDQHWWTSSWCTLTCGHPGQLLKYYRHLRLEILADAHVSPAIQRRILKLRPDQMHKILHLGWLLLCSDLCSDLCSVLICVLSRHRVFQFLWDPSAFKSSLAC